MDPLTGLGYLLMSPIALVHTLHFFVGGESWGARVLQRVFLQYRLWLSFFQLLLHCVERNGWLDSGLIDFH